jgi:hypothetical protein
VRVATVEVEVGVGCTSRLIEECRQPSIGSYYHAAASDSRLASVVRLLVCVCESNVMEVCGCR